MPSFIFFSIFSPNFFFVITLLFLSWGSSLKSIANENSSRTINSSFKALESEKGGRLGVFALNTETRQSISYHAGKTFPTGCTSKVIGVGTLLQKSITHPGLLSQKIFYTQKELDSWSPVTKNHLKDGMTIEELCAAAISLSDNSAMNLLLPSLGGLKGMNHFAHTLGNKSFQQDHNWPEEAFSGGIGNLQDSSTPKDMVFSLQELLLGTRLPRPQRDLLTTWMIATKTGDARVRAGIAKITQAQGWIVGDKTGTGGAYGTTNDLAIIWPPHHAPLLVGIYYTNNEKEAPKEDEIVARATKIAVEYLLLSDP